MPRYKLTLEYDGTPFVGWQAQDNGMSVQGRLAQAIKDFSGEDVIPAGAGRTDAGVHALNQVVHLDAPVMRDTFSWVRGTNRFLPADIAVQWCVQPGDGFHARNSARGRRYAYLLLESPVRPALESGLAGWVFRPLDGDAMRAAAALLIGEHDFTSFTAQANEANPVCVLRSLQVVREPVSGRIEITVESNRFLFHMVRVIAGTLIEVGRGRIEPERTAEILRTRNRREAGPTAAAHGLMLVGVHYET